MSSSKTSRPDRRSSSILRRTVDSCQWIAAASAAVLARPSRASSFSSGLVLGQERAAGGQILRRVVPEFLQLGR
jgi:hypothetical protein